MSGLVLRRIAGDGPDSMWWLGQEGRAPDTAWEPIAEQLFEQSPQVASLSVVPASQTANLEGIGHGGVIRANVASLPCFVNGRILELLHPESPPPTNPSRFEADSWMATATRKGLEHRWLISRDVTGGPRPAPDYAPSLDAWTDASPASRELDRTWLRPARGIAVGIDASWLLDGESGAQVFATEMIRELSGRDEIDRIVMLSAAGSVPDRLNRTAKVTAATWSAASAAADKLDVLHRPYQPGEDVDYRLYHAVARATMITVLDFIAYDNPHYHESPFAWRRYQRAFDVSLCAADQVLAISRHIGDRIERRFAHRLSAPVRSVPLGTDHLSAHPPDETPVASLIGQDYLLVLGNDFAHKNRDFAVRVFSELCRRGYQGSLVLGGFHLDLGSSHAYELDGATGLEGRVIRMGAVGGSEKAWLLRHAQAVLYPTSSEGFGLVPFEAAALGTPTAFVRFGALRETMPHVAACGSWSVAEFAALTESLLLRPDEQVAQIAAASAALTWRSMVDQLLDAYRFLCSDAARWRTGEAQAPVGWTIGETASEYALRARRKLGRWIDRPR